MPRSTFQAIFLVDVALHLCFQERCSFSHGKFRNDLELLCSWDQSLEHNVPVRKPMIHVGHLPRSEPVHFLALFSKYNSSSILLFLRQPAHIQVRIHLTLFGIPLPWNPSYLFKSLTIPPSGATHSSNCTRSECAIIRLDHCRSCAPLLAQEELSNHYTSTFSSVDFAFKLQRWCSFSSNSKVSC